MSPPLLMSARRKGANLDEWMVERIVEQLASLGVKTVNLGGNEPIFTAGLGLKRSLLHRVIQRLTDAGIYVGLTTSGVSLLQLGLRLGFGFGFRLGFGFGRFLGRRGRWSARSRSA